MKTSTVTLVPGTLFASAALLVLKLFTVDNPWVTVLTPVGAAVAYAILLLLATLVVTACEQVLALFDRWRGRVNTCRPDAAPAKAGPETRVIPSLY